MKSLNRDERWYVYLWILNTTNYKLYLRLNLRDKLIPAGRKMTNPKRHRELQKLGGYLVREALKQV